MQAAAKYKRPRTIGILSSGPVWLGEAVLPANKVAEKGIALFEEGSWLIAADASLYYTEKLRKSVGAVPTATDAELILKAYQIWGYRCTEQLYGDFAFVIGNTLTGEVFCGRDPFGVRPLFYAFSNDVFVFASELRLVVSALPEKPVVQQDYLLNSLVHVIETKYRTPFEPILRLPPAHTLHLTGEPAGPERYWKPDPKGTILIGNETEYIGMFRELLVSAVQQRCNGNASLGSELSGGLDSSTITGIAARFAAEQGRSFSAFSNVFPEQADIDYQDERKWISEMTTFQPINWKPVDSLGVSILDIIRDTLGVQGIFPQQNFNVFSHGLYRAAGEAGATVLLSGFGGDELVSARTTFPWNELITGGEWSHIFNELYGGGVTLKSLFKPGKIAYRYFKDLLFRPEYRSGVFTPELLGKRLENLPLQADYKTRYGLADRLRKNFRFPVFDTLAEKQLFRITMDHLPQRMETCYAAAAQYGLEYRYPLLDVNLVLTTLAFPPWLKQRHGTNRYLFRQAIKDLVPESIRTRNDKSGTTIPQTYYSLVKEKIALLAMIAEHSKSSALQEIFDFARFPGWYEQIVDRDPKELNYQNPGLFYTYLMIMEYLGNG